ncbi:ankyrin repeat, SAM and basic leucine zipper domain-containing protein 1-like [Cimex lectularius]|uniref:Ankyrin repeat, SAM and basic leucine zipper domain-containing protein 1 n=1 Tax=Cimex lectularius TaxID=79782 RepID=A0A8I6R793_CIMLE|nr:ankyrin repeat, SAM and basic leucine zipper domain-containing protein 1-like [Cimex lectularius]XP_014239776.1 ankyrin repeat, SAM and basic leucine zipper domain-containing protein 1-like [Cimex lectularius]XP_024080316.1 ankyrin repeat, SAM and basic leucine zipper domain-containing protein 1-like [Cimex lectularius]
MASRPAGFSDDSDEDDFSFYTPLNQTIKKPEIEISGTERLISAIFDRNIEKVQSLLSSNVDINLKEKSSGKWSPVMHAAYIGSKEILELLLKHGANPNDHAEMFTTLMCVCDSASKNDDELLECLELLLSQGADPNATDWYKTTALMFAVKRNHPKLVHKLLEIGCQLDQTDSDGWTPIFYAVDAGDAHMVQLLKDAGADLSLEDRRGRSLTEISSSKYYKDITEIVTPKDKSFEQEEKIESVSPTKRLTHFQIMLEECPNLSLNRLHGFHNEAIKIINGIGLNSLINIFTEKKIQLGEFLTWDDDQWIKAGVEMSYDRQKIKASVQKYHERSWSKQSLKMIDPKEQIDLLQLTQIMCNIVRQFHILSTTTHYYLKNCKPSVGQKEIKVFTEKGLLHLKLINTDLEFIKKLAEQIDKEEDVIPADLISPKIKTRKNFWKLAILPTVVITVILVQVPKFNLIKTFCNKINIPSLF